MLVRFNNVVLNVIEVKALYIKTEITPPVIGRKHWWSVVEELKPEIKEYKIVFAHRSGLDRREYEYSCSDPSFDKAKSIVKEIADQIMNLDPSYVDEVFNKEFLT